MRIKYLILLCGLFFCSISYSQRFGAFPPSTKWYQINTDTSRVIFNAPIDSQARRVSLIIHKMAKENPVPLGSSLKKINTVLHSRTTLANGYVGLAPFRSEYYLIPPSEIFNLGSNPWEEELAVHEYRHVQQFNNFNKGLSKMGSVILGEEGQALFMGLVIPDWFFEGDAVHTESALTPQGRGKLPNFFNGFHSLWREQRNYSWMKLRNGSLKDFVPSHYSLGYLLVNYGYLKYGKDFWQKVTNDAVMYKGLFYPLQKAIKRHAGIDYKTFREEAFEFYSHEVSRKRSDITERATVTNHYFPQFISEDSLLYLKDSYNSLPAFYIKDSTGEHKLTLKNISTENWFSYRNGTIAYTGYDVHPRWNLVDYSNIILYNIHTKTENRITTKGKYFTPDISPSGNALIAVSINDSVTSELHHLQKDGTLIKKIKAGAKSFFVHPRFVDENTVVVAERLSNSTMTLVTIDLTTGRREVLLPPANTVIGHLHYNNGSVYYVSSIAGNDDIYSIRFRDKKIFSLSSGQRGNYYPSVYNEQLTWSKFTSNGLQVQPKALSAIGGKEIAVAQWKEPIIPHRVAGADSLPNVLNVPARDFAVTRYNSAASLFNFHSWRPEFTDPEFTFNLYSDNILNTFSNSIFYKYNTNETSHAAGFNSYYGGFFPLLNAGYTYTWDRTIKVPDRTLTFNTEEARVGYQIPLNFTAGNTIKNLNFGTNFVYNKTTPTGLYKDSLSPVSNTYLSHFISWSQQLPRAVQHINPKFGYAFSLSHRHLLNDDGFQFLGGTRFFLPSVKNHSIVLAASIQETDTSNIVFSNRFANSRGYDDYFFSRMWRLSANYHTPLVYPDWGVGNIVYFLRIRSNLFYDFTKVYSNTKTSSRDLRSTGFEIYFDSKWWNSFPVTFGFRFSQLLDDDFSNNKAGRSRFEFIVPIDLIPVR